MSTICAVDHLYDDYSSQPTGFLTPPPTWKKTRSCPVMPASERKPRKPNQAKGDLFHVVHKVPSGDSPYVRAKHVQLIDKDPGRAVSLFWSAINAGDRVDSALKDMAVVMKQLDRSDEAIEAIKSFRHLCPPESQESLDNILVELYKQSGRIQEEIEMLQVKLKQVEEGIAFGGKRTKIARSQGKKVQITVEKEYSRLLGNLAWAYMQHKDFKSAEEHYRKALSLESDKNKQCNLAICLMHMNKRTEAKFLLQAIKVSPDDGHLDESYAKSYERAAQQLAELESQHGLKPMRLTELNNECSMVRGSGYQWDNRLFCFKKGVQPPPLPCFAKKMKNGAFTDYPYEKSTSLARRTNNCQFNVCQESYSACTSSYESPFCNLGLPKGPFTQPQCSRYGDQRKGTTGYGSSCRKLSFASSVDTESVHSSVNNPNCSTTPTEVPKVTLQIPEMPLPSMNRDFWTKNSSDSLDNMRAGEERVNSLTCDYQKSAAEERELPPDSVFHNDSAKTAESQNGDSDHCCELISAMMIGGGLTDDNAVESLTQQKTCGMNAWGILTWDHNKSWADMVEEDEQGGESWRAELNDENVDLNIISETPKSIDQAEKLSPRIEQMEHGGGYFTQPEKTTSVRRSLCFDQNHNPDNMESHCTEQLTAKVLTFEDQGSLLSDTKTMKRRNRLQVFQDITHVHENPTS